MKEMQESSIRVAKLPKIVRSRLIIFLLIWLIVNLSLPWLKTKLVLGSELWKWTLLIAMLSCGYHLISMMTQLWLYLLCWNKHFKKNKNQVYFAKGLRHGVNLVVLSGSILVAWVLYFRTSQGIKKTDDNDRLFRVGTWSFVTLTIAAVLWVVKSFFLLRWEAEAVYLRFSKRILSAGFQCYFLGHICGWHMGLFKPKTTKEQGKDDKVEEDYNTQDHVQALESAEVEFGIDSSQELVVVVESSTSNSTDQKKHKDIRDSKNKAKRILRIDKESTLYDIKKMTMFFVNLCRASFREDDGTSDVLQQCQKINPNHDPDKYLTVEDLMSNFKLEKKDADMLFSKLSEDDSPKISYKNFEKYMVKAQKNCIALGHTLLDAKEVVKVLDKVMTGFLIAIVIVAWLLLTNIATTKILILMASPLLAASFVSGDLCKKILEGIIFSFISHPFDVGDRCVIDKIELEVKHMSVLSTIFIVIGTNEEALYPNSALASMPIVNLKGEPDPRDLVELTLGSNYTKSMLDDLQNKINRLFVEDRGNKYEKAHTIVIKDIGDSVKMDIEYDHVMSIHETTHSQCLKKKRKQKSELLLQLKQMIEESQETNQQSN